MRSSRTVTALVVISAVVAALFLWVILPKMISRPRVVPPPVRKPVVEVGRIAIVVDDIGYNQECLEHVRGIKYPLTFAVLPNLAYTVAAASGLHDQGFELILHLPMEPKGNMQLEEKTITHSMDMDTVTGIVCENLRQVPFYKGVSNHMGSLATEDMQVMSCVLAELHGRKLYFLDSFVTAGSVVSTTAKEKQVKTARRDVFLDNDRSPGAIRRQLLALEQQAKKKGKAIGIGHDHKALYEVLREEMPRIAARGYRFVFVSELVE